MMQRNENKYVVKHSAYPLKDIGLRNAFNSRTIGSREGKSNLRSTTLLSISKADGELQLLLSPHKILQKWERICFLRSVLEDALMIMLTKDLKYCQLENIEQKVWKVCFYNSIELLRKECKQSDNPDTYKYLLISMIDEGVKYYNEVLVALENNYNFEIKRFLSLENSSHSLGYVGLALMAVQKIFIYLGDLERYRSSITENGDYRAAKKYYLNAAAIIPRNGRPFNQLAVLSVISNRKFDAVYYYVRCASASNTLQSSREALLTLYDEIRKKYENSVPLKSALMQKSLENEKRKMHARRQESLRHEIWIYPDDSSDDEIRNIYGSKQYIVTKEKVNDIKTRFLYSFTYVHGKLFLRVDMETFRERAEHMLKEFNGLLNFSPAPLDFEKMLQILAISIFSVVNWKVKADKDENVPARTPPNLAMVVCFDAIGLIMKRVVGLLNKKFTTTEQSKKLVETDQLILPPPLDEDIKTYLSVIAMWCDWLVLYADGCGTTVLRNCECYGVGGSKNCWSQFVSLMNALRNWNYEQTMENYVYNKKILNKSFLDKGGIEVKLPECVYLAGFTPMKTEIPPLPMYTYKEIDMEVARMCLRIRKILDAAHMLCASVPQVLEFSVAEDIDRATSISIVNKTVNEEMQNLHKEQHKLDQNSNIVQEEKKNSKSPAGTPVRSSKMSNRMLAQKKEEIDDEFRIQQEYQEHIDTMMKQLMTYTEIEIKPRTLIIDTNIFLDYLSGVAKLAEAVSKTSKESLFTLLIPLVVMNELNGLRKGSSSKIRESVSDALNYLKETANKNIKYVTTRGSILPNFSFSDEAETVNEHVETNDDKILLTCRNLCNSDVQIEENDGSRKVHRQIVLLTADRNLRIKALSSDIPSKDIMEFLTWAKLL